MPNACTVCAHEHRHTIEVGLANKVSAQTLGKKYGLSRDAILRHARNHLTPQMRAAILTAQAPAAIDLEQLRKTESEGLLSQLVTQRARLEQHTDKAAADGDLKAVAALEGQVLKNLALVGKLLGQFAQIHDVRHTNLLVSPDYLKLRALLVDTLRPFPEAARAVAAALHRMESDAAKEITDSKMPPLQTPPPPVIDVRALPPPPPSFYKVETA